MNTNGDFARSINGVGFEKFPSYTFGSEPSTGVYLESPGTASSFTISKNGAKRFRITNTKTQVIGVLQADSFTPTGVLSLPDGSVSAPALSYASAPSTGLYADSGNNQPFGISVGGTTSGYFNNSGDFTVPTHIYAGSGSASAASFAFSTDGSTGIYKSSGGTVGVSCAGTQTASFGINEFKSIQPIHTVTISPSQLVTTDGSSLLVGSGSGIGDVAKNSLFFGDGSDGALVLTSTTLTLTQDMNYSSMTLTSNAIIATAGFLIFCTGTCSIDSTSFIHTNGVSSVNQTGASGAGGGLFNVAGLSGGSGGGLTTNGNNGGFNTLLVGGNGGSGATVGIHTGGTGGSGSVRSYKLRSFGHVIAYGSMSSTPSFSPGTGGGGGAGSGSSPGGGGGGGAGVLYLACKTIDGAGTLRANGGNGAPPFGDASGGVGGGGGGGVVLFIYQNATGGFTNSQIQVAGGAMGTGGITTGAANGASGFIFSKQLI